MYFGYGDGSFETFPTEADAEKFANDSLDMYRDEADDGWSEESLNVCWGRILGQVSIVSEKPGPEGSEFEKMQERELVAVEYPTEHIFYENVVNAIREYPVTMLAGLFAEVTRLCIAKGVFNKDGGMERVVARLKAECQK